jgi:Na+/H+ antiporter
LALGCVLFTTTLVAVVAHYLVPGFTWATAFVLGALVSPPDAVAAAAALKGLPVPKTLTTILEGESLVNDATGLTVYRYAVAAVLTGHLVFWQAAVQLLWVAGAGIAIGFLLGLLLYQVHRFAAPNAIIDSSLTLLTPYAAYLLAEEVGVSSVLAVVTTGLVLNRRSAQLFTPASRLQVYAVWHTVTFLLNGLVFILIGFQLPVLLAGFDNGSYWALVGYASLVSLAVVGSRLLWMYPGAYLPRWLSRRIREQEPRPSLAKVTILAWAGMRGVVSLAAALALPLTLPSGAAFPQRNLILLLTFSVIFVTLVGQGLTLRPLIRWFHMQNDSSEEEQELALRVLLAQQTVDYLTTAGQAPTEVLAHLKTRYELRLHRLHNRAAGIQASSLDERPFAQLKHLHQQIIQFERGLIEQLRHAEQTSEEALRKVENELDLEEARLTHL